MSKKLNLVKYQRTSRIIQVVMKVFFWASLATSIVTFIFGTMLFLAAPDNGLFNAGSSTSLNLTLDGVLRYRLNADIKPENIKSIMTTIMFMACALSASIAPIFKQLASILGTIKENRPFAEENVKRLSIIGSVLVAGAFATRIAEGIVAMNIVNNLELHNIDVNFSPNMDMIIMSFIIFILAGVFKYGCYLQKEYDSTV
jgi:hypothetical protein